MSLTINLLTNYKLFVNLCIPLTLCCFCSLSLSLSLLSLVLLLLLSFTRASLCCLSLQAVSASSRRGSGSSSPRRLSLSSSLPLSLVCMLSCLYLCECCACLLCVVWPALFPGLHGGEEVVWIRSFPFGQSLKLLDVLLDLSSSLLFYNLHFCPQIVYTVVLLLMYSVHSTSIACLSVLGEGSLLCCSS